MPPISEDCLSQGESEMGDEGDSNFEQLMVSMLEERDKVNLRLFFFKTFVVCFLFFYYFSYKKV